MFVLATRRADFGHYWEKILKKRGPFRQLGSIEELQAFLRVHAARLVVVDLDLPDSRNPAILRTLVKECGAAKLMLGGVAFAPSAELAGLAVGAVACCSPSVPIDECSKIVDVVLHGGVWLSHAGIPALVEKLRNFTVATSSEPPSPISLAAAPAPVQEKEDDLKKLTRREREVAHLVSSGANNKIIARQLLITDRTVKAHLTAIYDKLNVSDRLQLALRMTGNQPAQGASEVDPVLSR